MNAFTFINTFNLIFIRNLGDNSHTVDNERKFCYAKRTVLQTNKNNDELVFFHVFVWS